MSRPWMPLYVADLALKTTHLSAAEFGGYMRLIVHYWAKGSLPSDLAMLQRICSMGPSEWQSCYPAIAAFFEIKEGKWMHDRIDKELQIAEIKYEKRASAGRLGGLSKASNARSNATAKSYQPQPQSHIDTPSGVSKKPSPQSVLETCLSTKTARDVIDHRKAKRSPLTPRAAEGLVAAFRGHGDCEAAAEAMIVNGWQGFKPEWMANNARAGPNGHRSISAFSRPSAGPRIAHFEQEAARHKANADQLKEEREKEELENAKTS